MSMPFTFKEVDYIKSVRTLSHIEAVYGPYRKMEILNAVKEIKSHKNKPKNGGLPGGLECTILIMTLANLYKCRHTTAFYIIQEAHWLMKKPMVVASNASFRNLKSRYKRHVDYKHLMP